MCTLKASVVLIVAAAFVLSSGNPRNKCHLKPGHSLMDWIRLGASGKDLTHVGPMAGKMKVSPRKLAEHMTQQDAWICIHGRVYNVTDYLSFHPGGIDQIMQGVGSDATERFNEVHPWVNYEKILAKCFIGLLSNATSDEHIVTFMPSKRERVSSTPSGVVNDVFDPNSAPINFDWIQKTDTLYLYFYTGAATNPGLEIYPICHQSVTVMIYKADLLHYHKINLESGVTGSISFKINYETGKIEVAVIKEAKGIWKSFGSLEKTINKSEHIHSLRCNYKVSFFKKISHDVAYIEADREDGALHNAPLGKYVYIYNEEARKPYTPLPCSLRLGRFGPENATTSKLCFMVKRYPNGQMSRYLTDRKVGDALQVSMPQGDVNLKQLERCTHVVMLAAGTGVAPMFNLLVYLMERRLDLIHSVTLIFFNKNEEDMLFKNELRAFAQQESRFTVEFVLSRPTDVWKGRRGHITQELVEEVADRVVPIKEERDESLFFYVCGPPGFTVTSNTYLKHLNISDTKMFMFPE